VHKSAQEIDFDMVSSLPAFYPKIRIKTPSVFVYTVGAAWKHQLKRLKEQAMIDTLNKE